MTGRPVRIRPATRQDLQMVLEMFDDLDGVQAAWRVFPVRTSLREEMRQTYEAALEDAGATLVVAEDGGLVVGMARGTVHRPSSFSDEQALELSSVYVRPSHRGRGIGRQLAARVAAFARGQGVDRITLKVFAQNEEAVAMWSRLGFSPRAIQMTARADEMDGSASTRRPPTPPG